jgi:hypothetical protein
LIGLYDNQGVLRFTGRDQDECLDYAELFAMASGSYSITCLEPQEPSNGSSGLDHSWSGLDSEPTEVAI